MNRAMPHAPNCGCPFRDIACPKLLHHPEQRPDEIYLGNTDADNFRKSGWKTKRLGKTPHYPDGRPYGDCGILGTRGRVHAHEDASDSCYHPWFVTRAEVEEEANRVRDNDVLRRMIASGKIEGCW